MSHSPDKNRVRIATYVSDTTAKVISAPGVDLNADEAYSRQSTAAKVAFVHEVQSKSPDDGNSECKAVIDKNFVEGNKCDLVCC